MCKNDDEKVKLLTCNFLKINQKKKTLLRNLYKGDGRYILKLKVFISIKYIYIQIKIVMIYLMNEKNKI